jgi:transposase
MAFEKAKRSATRRRPPDCPMTRAEWHSLGERAREWIWYLVTLAGKNSHNSSQPPSRDGTDGKQQTNEKRRRQGKKRRPGGQPGHPGRQRELVPKERVDERQEHVPEECRRCGRDLGEVPADSEPLRHQVAEIPEIRPIVTEYICHRVTCPDCGTTTTAPLPEGVPPTCFGPNLRALVVLLAGRYRISRRETVDLCESVFGLSVSVGSVANIVERASEALSTPYEEVAEAVKSASVAYMDETGWRQKGQGIHLWILVTTLWVLFRIGRRTKEVAQQMLGEGYGGLLVSDRYGGYVWVADERHQVCWSHLNRDIERLIQRGGAAEQIGTELRAIHDDLFTIWHAYLRGEFGWDILQRRMSKVEVRAGEALVAGTRCRDPAARTLCNSLTKIERSLFVFARAQGVEPTNNTGERGIRPAVQWRKICFGTQSENGSRFVERILTVVATCRAQQRPLLPYLRQVLAAADAGDEIPSLVAGATARGMAAAGGAAAIHERRRRAG